MSVACFISFVWVSHRSPHRLIGFQWGEHSRYQNRPNRPGWAFFAWFLLSMCGLAILIGFGVYAVLGWMPGNWGGYDEDGQWTTARVYTTVVVTLWLWIVGVDFLLKHAALRRDEAIYRYTAQALREGIAEIGARRKAVVSRIESDATAGDREEWPAIPPGVQRGLANEIEGFQAHIERETANRVAMAEAAWSRAPGKLSE